MEQVRALQQERDALKDDLKACAEALQQAKQEIAAPGFGVEGYRNAVNVHALISLTLARPSIQALLM